MEDTLARRFFRSLRVRLLAPLLAVSFIAAILVAGASYFLGARWAMQEVEQRFEAIRQTLETTAFPLSENVLTSLAGLTQTNLVTLDSNGLLLTTTHKGNWGRNLRLQDLTSTTENPDSYATNTVELDHRRFVVYSFQRSNVSRPLDGVAWVLVMFDQTSIDATRRRAALLPLATGISTLVLLTSLSLYMTSRITRRLSQLQLRVLRVSQGDFDSQVSDHSDDEIGQLGNEVDAMAGQLKRLWTAVNQQQSEKLLHQIASGMAHQLRNSLTGARLAIELHARQLQGDETEGLRIAIQQIEAAEDYVQRLIRVGTGQQERDRPANTLTCLQDIRSSLIAIANHRHVNIQWSLAPELDGYEVKDGPTLSAAITNLVINAIDLAEQVRVQAVLKLPNILSVVIFDDGPGVPESIAQNLFEPFVTSKPEGLGLGLPLVRRAAEHLEGSVEWKRTGKETCFLFYAKLSPIA